MSLDTFEKLKKENTHEPSLPHTSYMQDDMDAMKHKIEKRRKKQKKQQILFSTLFALVTLFAVLFAYSQYKLHTLSQQEVVPSPKEDNASTVTTSMLNASSSPADVIKTLSRHILLPTGNPQIALIQDIAKLKETQSFFKDAQNGDIVVVYETMIYIYRPSKDVLVATSDISGVGQTKP